MGWMRAAQVICLFYQQVLLQEQVVFRFKKRKPSTAITGAAAG